MSYCGVVTFIRKLDIVQYLSTSLIYVLSYAMTYYINVKPSNLKDFLQIIKSLKNFGVIDSYGSAGELAREGEPISTEDLITLLEYARQEVKAGNTLTSDEVKKQVESWTL